MNRILRIRIVYGSVLMERYLAYFFVFVANMESLVKAEGKLVTKMRQANLMPQLLLRDF